MCFICPCIVCAWRCSIDRQIMVKCSCAWFMILYKLCAFLNFCINFWIFKWIFWEHFLRNYAVNFAVQLSEPSQTTNTSFWWITCLNISTFNTFMGKILILIHSVPGCPLCLSISQNSKHGYLSKGNNLADIQAKP